MRAPLFLPLFALVAGAGSCVDEIPLGECNSDEDCSAERPRCLFDVDQDRSYCTNSCTTDRDCPRSMACREGTTEEISGAPSSFLCVRRIRSCDGPEICNGLDDDCNGVVDDEGCTLQENCLDDRSCGAFVCVAPENQARTFCAPFPEDTRYGDDCTSGDECPNGECSTGFCTPFCRARANGGSSCDDGLLCARGMGSRSRPQHNLCQQPCLSPGECDEGTECVWRDIYQPADVDHASVCATLDPERLALGEPCNGNTIEGDDSCRYGLCLNRVCTRICGGPGSSCADLGPGFECQDFVLRYSGFEFSRFVCRRP